MTHELRDAPALSRVAVASYPPLSEPEYFPSAGNPKVQNIVPPVVPSPRLLVELLYFRSSEYDVYSQ